MLEPEYPDAIDPSKIGEYEPRAFAGGGYTWDAVLEYRVWMHPGLGAPDHFNGDDYYIPFATYAEARHYSETNAGCNDPIALILQREYISEPQPGVYEHVKKERITEWLPQFLKRPRRTDRTIPDFLAPDAPPNRLDILRGEIASD